MNSDEEEITYDEALENGLINSYSDAVRNGLLHHYETGIYHGDIIQTKEDIRNIFGLTMYHYNKALKEFKTKPEFNIYEQYKFKTTAEKEIISLKNEITVLRRSRFKYKKAYLTLLENLNE